MKESVLLVSRVLSRSNKKVLFIRSLFKDSGERMAFSTADMGIKVFAVCFRAESPDLDCLV